MKEISVKKFDIHYREQDGISLLFTVAPHNRGKAIKDMDCRDFGRIIGIVEAKGFNDAKTKVIRKVVNI